MTKLYQTIAINVLNFLVLFIALNLTLALFFSVKDKRANNKEKKKIEALRNASPYDHFTADGYPIYEGDLNNYIRTEFDFRAFENADEQETIDMLVEANQLTRLGFDYQELGVYAEPIFDGDYINIELDSMGFPNRKVVQTENPKNLPVKEIFLFGGSTTMGMHVADKDTYASYLAKHLNLADSNSFNYVVFNYGRIGHTPTQEVMLFYDLLRMGRIPDLAIFMDGLNKGSGQDLSAFSSSFAQLVLDNRTNTIPWGRVKNLLSEKIPLYRLAKSISKQISNEQEELETPDLLGINQTSDTTNYTLNRFLENYAFLDFLEERFEVPILVFSQPDVSTHYNLDLLRQGKERLEPARERLISKFYEPLWSNYPKMIRLDHLFEKFGYNRRAIIDDCHYSPSFNEFLAVEISLTVANKIVSQKPKNILKPTGSRRTLSEMQIGK
jgi:hypothetical protein